MTGTAPSDLNEVLGRLTQLPAIPAAVQEVIDSLNDPQLDTITLVRKIGKDQGLVAGVLRVANSSFYGLQRQVASLQEAIMVLGFSAIRTLVISAGLVGRLSSVKARAVDQKRLWEHCFQTAVCARAIAKCTGRDQEVAFTAGLLHDIGLLALDICLPQYAKVLAAARSAPGKFAETEQAMLGFDHATAGAEVAKRWNFPPVIQDAIRFHHAPEAAPAEDRLAGIIHLADLMALEFDRSGNSEEMAQRVPEAAMRRLGLERERLKACLPDAALLNVAAGSMLGA